MVLCNTGDRPASTVVHMRLYQTSSATAAPVSERIWKKIELLAGQTVLESAPIDLPAVTGKRSFLIQWLDGDNHVLGRSEVLVYPANLLGELKPLLGEESLGILDPNNELKPLLKRNHVDFLDLGATALEEFQGRLAIVGPFSSRTQIHGALTQAIRKIARNGVGVVWIQPSARPDDSIMPSFYVVPEGKGSVVVVREDMLANPAVSPKSQLNLVHFCKLALNTAPFSLPDVCTHP